MQQAEQSGAIGPTSRRPGFYGAVMATTTGDLVAVELPPIGTLTQAQVRGAACVWSAVMLRTTTAIDLGPREAEFHGTVARWFPRGCRSCAVQSAYLALLGHAQCCDQCEDDPARCEPGGRLRRAVREAGR